MNKEYNDTKVKPSVSTFQKPKEASRSEAQNVLSKKSKRAINFDDKKYGVKIPKIDQYLPNKKQESFGLKDFLRSIPIMGRFLVDDFNKAKDEACVDNKRTKEVGSKLENGNVEQVDKKKKNLGP